MRFLKRCLPVLSLAGLLFLALPSTVHADVNNFTITDFHADETLTRQDPQGELHIVETIKVNFADNNHGIERAIPASYNGDDLHFHLNKVTSTSGAPVQVSTRHENGNVVLRIGDPNRTVTGQQEYTIDYIVQNVINFYGDHDELYWDINGDQWNQPTTHVSVVLHLPQGLKLHPDLLTCYAGPYGETEHACQISAPAGNIIQASADNLLSQQTLTIVAGFDTGYFAPPTLLDKLRSDAGLLLGLVGLPLLGLVAGFSLWWRKGRDAKGRGTIVPEYAPPEDLSPLRAGTVADFQVDDRDLTATVVDLARRGYVRIIETRKNRSILKDKLLYTLELLKADTTDLDEFEAPLIRAMFNSFKEGSTLDLGEYNSQLGKTASKLRVSVVKVLTNEGYFASKKGRFSPLFKGVVLALWVVIALVGILERAYWPVIVGSVVGLIIFGIFMIFMPARTARGTAAREQLLGLKMYMQTAEKDRLEKLEGPAAAYAAKTGEPAHTVEFFEKLLPYAIVLGVETQWAAQFAGIYDNPPDWYRGNNLTAFNAGYLAGALSSGMAPAMNSSFTAPSSSSGSGFSGGGGFAGGGGGGGGGGGW